MSLIGVILLMGIVAKNAILLIDFAKWSEERGMERREALIEAAQRDVDEEQRQRHQHQPGGHRQQGLASHRRLVEG